MLYRWLISIKDGLLNKNLKANELTRIILEVINEKQPQSIKHLTKIIKEDFDLTEEEIIESVLKLQAQGAIIFENQTLPIRNLKTYLKTGEAIWYLLTIVTVIIATLVFTISESVYPWIYGRNVLGLIFILFLPGFAFIKAIFPIRIPTNSSNSKIEEIEQIALSIGMSIALVSTAGLLLYYSPWGLDVTTIVLFLVTFTPIFTTAAVIKEYRAKKNVL